MIIFRFTKGDERLIEEYSFIPDALDRIAELYSDNPIRLSSDCPPTMWGLESIDHIGWEKNDREYKNNLFKIRKLPAFIGLLHTNHRKQKRKLSKIKIAKALKRFKELGDDEDTYLVEQEQL